ncbi:hypothetical protein HELRODRAFT_183353 [Helobdella robusta]|uniref:Uncharacterized protein n=1 Tax=Helobdella robusta TaxID=6412 RepID=T1FJI1_HELRO|nr:hypothetical protein HELRODRAFT_183353 [Helobdella robusta]ESO11250.1 hypothetical protein HELRODRAFT_183353 [Helobdella robusta]
MKFLTFFSFMACLLLLSVASHKKKSAKWCAECVNSMKLYDRSVPKHCFIESSAKKCDYQCFAYLFINITASLVKITRSCVVGSDFETNFSLERGFYFLSNRNKSLTNCYTPDKLFSTSNLGETDIKLYKKAIKNWKMLAEGVVCGKCRSALKKGDSANTAPCFSKSPLTTCAEFCYAFLVIFRNDSTVDFWRDCVDERMNDDKSLDEFITLSATFDVNESNCGTAHQLFNVSHLGTQSLNIFKTFADTWTVSGCDPNYEIKEETKIDGLFS